MYIVMVEDLCFIVIFSLQLEVKVIKVWRCLVILIFMCIYVIYSRVFIGSYNVLYMYFIEL